MTSPTRPTILERLTKPSIIVSLLVAAWLQVSLVSAAWPAFPRITVAAFVLSWAGCRWWPAATRRMALFATYLVPGALVLLRDAVIQPEWLLWIAAVFGVMFSTRAPLRWSLPHRWKLPLVYWGVLVACTWPLVALREADFDLSQLHSLFATSAGMLAMWTMTGILWFDWLFSAYSSQDPMSFETEILLPLGTGWAVAGCIGVYQMFGSMTFLNPGFWSVLRRATGPLGDANLFGVISALWGPALAAVASTRACRWTGWWIAAMGLPLSWLALWASGSRSSLPVALLGLVGLLIGVWRSSRSKRVMWGAVFAIVVMAAIAGIAVARGGASVSSPISRLLADYAPRWSIAWVGQAVARLWSRDRYGTIATEMIRRFPLFGVGQGAFYELVHVFSWMLFRILLIPDNAQNWYRHQVAELGIVGSVGWMVWTFSFLYLLLTARDRPNRRLSGPVVRLLLIGFGLISLVGMPAQSIVVAFTFWTLAFWFLRETGTTVEETPKAAPSLRLAWAALWLLVIVHMAGTAYVGWTVLRPPVRAQWADMDYSLGLYVPANPDYSEFHRTKQRAVAVVPAPTRWVAVTVAVNHAGLDRQPVDVKVWIDRTLTLRTRLRTPQPVTRYVRVPDGERRIIVETWVSRIVRASDAGNGDPPERGLLVRWTFVDAPPPDGTVAGR